MLLAVLIGVGLLLLGEAALLFRFLRRPRALPALASAPALPAHPPSRAYADTFVVWHGEELMYRGESAVMARNAYLHTQSHFGPVQLWHGGVLQGEKS